MPHNYILYQLFFYGTNCGPGALLIWRGYGKIKLTYILYDKGSL